ncbi:DUF4956 domain-containing protein [Brumimicrobium salinarum]|uniref:DUF4956 domain-containing protein n=2 Tax=Brumimicrobium salinarum TaxID=2058658 RepID=A0A2I0R3V8_9FLAO|nr:DUF4956 domain-containing protein [Brumimicrobium salinarum]
MSTQFTEMLNIQIYNPAIFSLLFRLLLNFFFLTIIVRWVYYPKTKRKDYVFTYLLIGLVTFFLSFALKKFDIGIGMGLGLFAIFGIIRYRTQTIEIKEMTYLFVVIGLSVINAMATEEISLLEVLLLNGTVIIIISGLEYFWWKDNEQMKIVIYEKIDLIRPENYNEMKHDLEQRTGLTIIRFEVGNTNFLNDTAEVKVYYK